MKIRVRAIVNRLNRGAKRAQFTVFTPEGQFTHWLNYKNITSDEAKIRPGHFVDLELDESWAQQQMEAAVGL